MGEAGLAAPINFVVIARHFTPKDRNYDARPAQEVFDSRLRLVTRQLARSPYLAGEQFTAADISVTYALELAQKAGGVVLGEAEQSYVSRTSAREGYKRAMQACPARRAWFERAAAQI